MSVPSFMPHGSNPQTASFTCNTCGIKFVTAELQRQHMKTDWHRYNLKRRVAELPSITSDVFAEKILNQQTSQEPAEEDEYGFYVARRRTKATGNGRQITKKLIKQQQRQLHEARGRPEQSEVVSGSSLRAASPATSIASEFSQFSLGDSDQLHEVASTTETGSELNYSESDFTDLEGDLLSEEDEVEDHDADVESESESLQEIESIPITHCFYCGDNNHEVENNIRHMYSRHGLYIPERSYLVDLEGLLHFLSEVVSIDHECLVCGFEGKNLESIRQHIYAKGHCKIPYESKEEKQAMAEFYDFYTEEEKPKRASTSKSVAFKEVDDQILVDVHEDEQREEDDDENVDDDDRMAIDNGINDNYSLVHVDRSGVELTLPTGSRIGHRSMARYYRQNIALPTEPSESSKTVALVDRRFASGLSAYQVSKEEKEIRKIELQVRNNYERKTKNRRVNFQKHFRDELLGPM